MLLIVVVPCAECSLIQRTTPLVTVTTLEIGILQQCNVVSGVPLLDYQTLEIAIGLVVGLVIRTLLAPKVVHTPKKFVIMYFYGLCRSNNVFSSILIISEYESSFSL